MATEILVAGIDQTANAKLEQLDADQNVGARGHLSMTFLNHSDDNTGYEPQMDELVQVVRDSQYLYAGNIVRKVTSPHAQPNIGTLIKVDVNDYSIYEDRTSITHTFPEGTTLKAIYQYVVTNHLAVFGVLLDPGMDTGPALEEQVFKNATAKQVFDLMTATTGYIRYFDVNKTLYAFLPGARVADFDFTVDDVLNWTLEESRTSYYNTVTVEYGSEGNFDKSTNIVGDGVTRSWLMPYAVRQHYGYVDLNGIHTPIAGTEPEAVANGLQMYFDYATNALKWRSDLPALPVANTIDMLYSVTFPESITVSDATEVGLNGPWPGRFKMPDNYDVYAAQAYAQGELRRSKEMPKKATLTTHNGPWYPGTTSTLFLSTRGMTGSYLITQVAMGIEEDGMFYWTVTLLEGSEYKASWIDYFKNLTGGGSGATGTGGSATGGGPTGGGGSGGTAGVGTPGTIPVWGTVTSLTDSIISQAGGVVTVAGTVTALGFTGSGADLTALPASQLTGVIAIPVQDTITHLGTIVSGVVPWPIVDKLGSSLADLTTRSASDLSSGNLAYARMPLSVGTWTAQPTITGATTFNSTISVNSSIVTPPATDLVLLPTGNLITNPAGKNILPFQAYDINIGSLSKKFLALHAAELWVETLVAQNTIATIGGRILVAPTNLLVQDVATGDTTIVTKYNNITTNDIIYMEANGKVEFMQVTGGGSSTSAGWALSGTMSLLFAPPSTTIGAGYAYTVTRNLDGTGANVWNAGDALVNTGQTGNGFIDLYSTRGVRAGTEIGPTIVGNVRVSSTYNDWEPRWAIGNLDGLYGYSGSKYGAAFGKRSLVGGVWIGTNVTIDATNGFRVRYGDTVKIQLDTAGNATFTGSVTATSGLIGNWAISSGGILYDTGTNATSAGMVPGDYPFFAGATYGNRATAPFRVTPAGALVANSANVTGTITANAGAIGNFTIDPFFLQSARVYLYGGGQIAVGDTGGDAFWIGSPGVVGPSPYVAWYGDSVGSGSPVFSINGIGTMVLGGGASINSASDGVVHVDYTGGVAGAKTMIGFYKSGVIQGSITSNTANTQYNTTSDRRLKEQIVPTRYGLDTLMAIQIVDYYMRDDDSRTLQTGCIAQDVHPLYPVPVTVPYAPDEAWQMDYAKFTPLLMKAVQELTKRVRELERDQWHG